MRYVFFDRDGVLHPSICDVPPKAISAHTPAGYTAVAHPTAHPERHRLDVTTGKIVDEHTELAVRNEAHRRAASLARAQAEELRRLEAESSTLLRKYVLGESAALKRLRVIDAQIDTLKGHP